MFVNVYILACYSKIAFIPIELYVHTYVGVKGEVYKSRAENASQLSHKEVGGSKEDS
jgi:hypothetical protein